MAPTTDPQDETYLDHIDPELDPGLSAAIKVQVEGAVEVADFPARTIVTDQAAVPAAGTPPVPLRVVGPAPNRVRLTLRARGGDIIVGGPQITLGSGFLIKQDVDSHIITATAAVYAISVAGGTLHLMAEHRDG